MAVTNGGELREWRRSRGWDVPELARRLRRAADEPIAAHEGLVRMIRAWERGDHRPSERYELLYRRLGLPPGNENGSEPQPTPTRHQEGTEPVRRRTFVELTGISLAGAMLPGAAIASPAASIEPLVLMLTGTGPEPPAAPPDLTGLALSAARARKDYQACRYAELVSRLPRLLSQLDTGCRCLTGDDRLRACALSADAYHVAAGFLLKTGDPGLAHVATDRSMTAALDSQDPLTHRPLRGSDPLLPHGLRLAAPGPASSAVIGTPRAAATAARQTGFAMTTNSFSLRVTNRRNPRIPPSPSSREKMGMQTIRHRSSSGLRRCRAAEAVMFAL
jgi:transcriptional regulator with XRE-family HTH domain